jgi:hypothetical protein
VGGIPHLVVVDKDWSLLCEDAVSEVTEDPDATAFPWRCPSSVIEILPDTYLRSDGAYRRTSDLDNKYLMLYFSASWSQRMFVSKLLLFV